MPINPTGECELWIQSVLPDDLPGNERDLDQQWKSHAQRALLNERQRNRYTNLRLRRSNARTELHLHIQHAGKLFLS